MMHRIARRAAKARRTCVAFSFLGCVALAGCGDSSPPGDTSATGAGGAPGTGSSSSVGGGGMGAASSSSSAGGGGASSAGGGGAGGALPECQTPAECPGADSDCANRTCVGGSCGTAVEAAGLACDEGGGLVCDGHGACVFCAPGSTVACYAGPAGTDGVGVCKAGTSTCDAAGASFGSCVGEVKPSVETCATPGDDDCDGKAAVCKGDHLFSRSFGGPGEQNAWRIATEPSGDTVVVGTFQGTTDFGGGPLTSAGGRDAYVVKLDAAGNHLWSKRFGDLGDQWPNGVAIDGVGNIVIVGKFEGTIDFGGGPLTSAGNTDVFVAKLDAAGNHLWSKSFGDAVFQGATAVAVDAADDVLLAGDFSGTLALGGAPLVSLTADIFVAKLDAAGDHLWSKRFGDAATQGAKGITVDGAGDVILVGSLGGQADFGGGPLVSAGASDVFVAKFDGAGNHLWSKRFGDIEDQFGSAVTVDAAGNLVVSGSAAGTVDFGGGASFGTKDWDAFLLKLDASGNHLWSKRFGNAGFQDGSAFGTGVAVDAEGYVLLSVQMGGTVDFGGGPSTATNGIANPAVAKFDAAGAYVWSKHYPASGGSNAVTVDAAGNVRVAGFYFGTIDLGGGVLPGDGALGDGFLLCLTP